MSDFRFEIGSKGELRLGGRLTIENSAGIKAGLLEALDARDNMEVCVEAASVADLSLLQLLCSAHYTAIKRNKQFVLKQAGGNLAAEAEAAGLGRHKGCGRNAGNDCLWACLAAKGEK